VNKIWLSKLLRYLLNFSTVIFILVVFCAIYRRIYFGVDLVDEAFHVTDAVRLDAGVSIFEVVIYSGQFAYIMIYPFIKFYRLLMGSYEGIILFVRHLHLLMSCSISLSFFLLFKKMLGWRAAAVTAVVFICFFPINIPSLGYNAMGNGLFILGCLAGYCGIKQAKCPQYLFLAGISHSLSVLSYPPLIIPIIFYLLLICLVVYQDAWSWKRLGCYVTGGLVPAIPFLIMILTCSFPEHSESMNQLSSKLSKSWFIFWSKMVILTWNQVPRIPGLHYLCPPAWRASVNRVCLLLIMGVLLFLYKKKWRFFSIVLVLLPLLPLYTFGYPYSSRSCGYIAYLAMMAPCLFLFRMRNRKFRDLMMFLWLPSFSAGMTMGFFSNNYYCCLSSNSADSV